MRRNILLISILLFGLSTLLKSQTNHVDGQTTLINPNGRTLLIERNDADSWLTFHDPENSWYSFGIDQSKNGSLILNYGGSVGEKDQFVLTKDGLIGIGTATPIGNFEIASSTGAILTLSTNKRNGSTSDPLKSTINFLGYLNGNKAQITATDETYDTHGSRLSFLINDGSNSTSLVERLTILRNGYIGIGTSSPEYRLDVIGTVRAREIKVDLNGADFVFDDDYNLKTLNEVESYVKENKHLPEIESAGKMESEGANLGELNTKLLLKIEELTLYMIEMNKRMNLLETENIELKDKITKLESMK